MSRDLYTRYTPMDLVILCDPTIVWQIPLDYPVNEMPSIQSMQILQCSRSGVDMRNSRIFSVLRKSPKAYCDSGIRDIPLRLK